MKTKHDITFVIVSYNSAKTLRGSIESCLVTVQKNYASTGRVVVYDNASSDICPEIIDEYTLKYPNVFLGIKSESNIGFGQGNNKAVAASPSNVYVLVNPDVLFKPEAITSLYNTLLSASDIAIVCPKLVYLDKTPQKSIRRFPTFNYLLLKYMLGKRLKLLDYFKYYFDYYYLNIPPPHQEVEVNWGIGAFMMVSGEYVVRYGLFDERFFLYFEDVSLCVDAWQNGYRVLFQPQATALHLYMQASTSRFNYLTMIHITSALKFFAKYRPYQKRWQLVNWLLNINLRFPTSLNLRFPIFLRSRES